MMIFNRRKRIDQNMEQISLLDQIRYQLPCPKAPCVHIPHSTQDSHQLAVDVNKKHIKEDQLPKHQKKKNKTIVDKGLN